MTLNVINTTERTTLPVVLTGASGQQGRKRVSNPDVGWQADLAQM